MTERPPATVNTALNLDPVLKLPTGTSNGVSSPIVPPNTGIVNPEKSELTHAANMLGTISNADNNHRRLQTQRQKPGDEDYWSEDEKSDVEDIELEIALRRRDKRDQARADNDFHLETDEIAEIDAAMVADGIYETGIPPEQVATIFQYKIRVRKAEQILQRAETARSELELHNFEAIRFK